MANDIDENVLHAIMDEATQEEKETVEKTNEPMYQEKDTKLRQEELMRS